MVYAAELARLSGRLTEADVDRHRQVLGSLGLPTTYRGDRWPALLEAMRVDKKSRGTMLRFIVLDAVGRPGLLEAPDPQVLSAAFAEISQ
jgi:3-dehydroquinate synthase